MRMSPATASSATPPARMKPHSMDPTASRQPRRASSYVSGNSSRMEAGKRSATCGIPTRSSDVARGSIDMSVHGTIPPLFISARLATHRAQIVEINIEYVTWTLCEVERMFGLSVKSLLGMSVPEYVNANIAEVCEKLPPEGVFYLVEQDGSLAGMGGLRRIGDGVAEIKRMYVRPAHRGKGLGDAILQRLLADADAFGYPTQRLDSAPFMTAAHAL